MYYFTVFLNFWTIVYLFWCNTFNKLMIFIKSTTKLRFRFNMRLHKFKISLCTEQWVPHAIPGSLQEEPGDRADRCLSYPGQCFCLLFLSSSFAMMRRRNLQLWHFQDWGFHPPSHHPQHHLQTLRTVCKAASKKEQQIWYEIFIITYYNPFHICCHILPCAPSECLSKCISDNSDIAAWSALEITDMPNQYFTITICLNTLKYAEHGNTKTYNTSIMFYTDHAIY